MSGVTCPGCNRVFTAGRSMSVHLYRSSHCRSSHLSLQGEVPFWLVPDVLIFPTGINACTQNEPLFHSDDFFPEYDGEDEEMGQDVPENAASLVGDEALLDVVVFPKAYTTAQKYEAELLKIIHSIGAPNGAFQSIMSWACCAVSEGYDFQPSPLAYDRQILQLEKMVGMQSCRPTRVSVDLYRPDMEEDMLDVVVFDFPTMLASLFNCPVLNQMENLVVNAKDRFAKYEAPNGLLGEVNSGVWYDKAYANLVTNPEKDFLCPIIFAMDKTVISEMAGLHVFVILFTTSIFNRKVCCFMLCRCLTVCTNMITVHAYTIDS
jgi:hypothetical protein